jgi:hypothetical protein
MDRSRATRPRYRLRHPVGTLALIGLTSLAPPALAWDTSCCGKWIHVEAPGQYYRDGCVKLIESTPPEKQAGLCRVIEAKVKEQTALCPELLDACDPCKRLPTSPDKAASDSWKKLSSVSGVGQDGQEAINRVLESPAGRKLEEDLQKMFCKHPGDDSCWPRVQITFGSAGSDEGGHVKEDQFLPRPFDPESEDPAKWKAFSYHVTIVPQVDSPAPPPHYWPGTGTAPCDIRYNFSSGVSEMATSVYHELLHVWWMNQYQTTDTGHGREARDCSSYEKGFLGKLKDFYGEMDELEACRANRPPVHPGPAPTTSPGPGHP